MRRLARAAAGAGVAVLAFAVGQIAISTIFGTDLPGLGGRVFLHTDSPFVGRDNGVTVDYWSGMNLVTVPPAFGTWTQVNFGTSTVNQTTGGIYIGPQLSAGLNLRILALPIPATPYTLTARIRFASNEAGGGHAALGWRQSASGRLVMMEVGAENSARATFYGFGKWTSATVFSAFYDSMYNTGARQNIQYFRISDDGTNLSVSISVDGFNWLSWTAAQSRTDFMLLTGPDQYVFECDTADGSFGAQCTLESLVQS